MRAMSQAAYGKPSLLQVVDVALPAPGPEQEAWERSMAGRAVGKIVIEVGADV